MTKAFEHGLSLLKQNASELKHIQRGIEKESLRITPQGTLSQTVHPKALGSTLTHPNITTDYSEALLELITEPHESIDALLQQLKDTHTFVYQNIGDELLWVNSMPCILGGDSSIPIAQYGSSNIGKMKTVYRHGLWHRYGRHMQAIAGIHFNFSLPQSFWSAYQAQLNNNDALQDFISAQYFKLIRNFQRYSWLLVYLFGASPAVCASFVKNKQHRLKPLNERNTTFHLPDATSLRMSDLGYQNNAQSNLKICYNSLDSYTCSLEQAIRTPYAPYEKIGIKEGEQYKQLNANILQIENEFYSSIRPKRTSSSGERPTLALRRRGVEYIEVRCLDLNPFEPIGLNAVEIYFLDAFLLMCLIDDDIQTSETMRTANAKNMEMVVYQGRSAAALIADANTLETQSLKQHATILLDKIRQVAEVFDAGGQHHYQHSVEQQSAKINQPELTPSGQIIELLTHNKLSFFELALEHAQTHQAFFKGQVLEPTLAQHMQKQVDDSIAEQAQLEKNDTVDFDTFVANYFKG